MRILLTTTSGVGHLHPLIPLARAAVRAGHDVRIAAPGSLGATLRARGLPHLELPDYGPQHLARVDDVMRRLGPPGPGSEVLMLREVFGWAKTDSTLQALRNAVATWRPDVVLHEAAELSGPLAAEAAGVAHATVAIALRRTITTWVGPMVQGAAPLATSIGLAPDLEACRILDVPFASLVPPSLEEPDSVMPARVVRYRLTDVHVPAPAPELRGTGPLVWIALGTEAWRVPGVMDRVLPLLQAVAARKPRLRFLLTTGAADAVVPTMPDNVQIEAYAPQEQVLEQCAVVLGHGGFNTTMAALSHAVPQVVMPLFSTDQFETAARLATVGAAVTAMDPTPETLGAALERALADASLASTVAIVADEMARLATPDEAVERLLELARADRAPAPRPLVPTGR